MSKRFYVNKQSFKERFTKVKDKGFPVGSRIYTGHQGTGKTLSMVEYAMRIKNAFPDSILVSNIILDYDDYVFIENDRVLDSAMNSSSGEKGMLILLDEAHLYFGRKNGIPLQVLSAISQQRKDRKRIVFSSQIWEELDISLRKQVKEIVHCKRIGRFQINSIFDGESLTYDKLKSEYVADKIRTEIFKHNDKLYQLYNTRQRIAKNEDMIELPTARAPSGSAAPQSPKQQIKKGFL